MTKVSLFFTMSLALASGGAVLGAPIKFVHQGTGSGRIGAIDFADAAFVIEAFGDTDAREEFGAFAYLIPHASATIDISGVGVFQFVTSTLTFSSNWPDAHGVGFSSRDPGGLDLFDGPFNSFPDWDMESSIGPVEGPCTLLEWGERPVETSGGVLFFDSQFETGSFTATILPEPTCLPVFALGLVFAIFVNRRSGR
jgi:hypothetical protein